MSARAQYFRKKNRLLDEQRAIEDIIRQLQNRIPVELRYGGRLRGKDIDLWRMNTSLTLVAQRELPYDLLNSIKELCTFWKRNAAIHRELSKDEVEHYFVSYKSIAQIFKKLEYSLKWLMLQDEQTIRKFSGIDGIHWSDLESDGGTGFYYSSTMRERMSSEVKDLRKLLPVKYNTERCSRARVIVEKNKERCLLDNGGELLEELWQLTDREADLHEAGSWDELIKATIAVVNVILRMNTDFAAPLVAPSLIEKNREELPNDGETRG